MAVSEARPARRRVFTYEEAVLTFPAVRGLTHAAVRRIEAMVNRLPSRDALEARREELEAEYNRILEAWGQEIEALGCEVKGLWLVDWDAGDGYYCWRYPEEILGHFHGYEDGFEGRVQIT